MTAASVAFDGTRIDDAELQSTGWYDLAGGKATQEPDFVWQNTYSMSNKVGTSEEGVCHDDATTHDLSTSPKVVLYKHVATNFAVLNNKGSTGGILEIGSGGRRSAYDRYYVVGGDTYPPKGGYLITPIDPNGNNYSARPGTAPTLTAIDYFGWACTFSAASKSDNVAMDALDYIGYGQGLTVQYGTGADPAADFDDFVTFDEGTKNNRYGIVTTQSDVLFVIGTLNIGTSNQTIFTDSNKVIVFPEAEFLNTTGFFGVAVDLQATSTAVSITSCVFKSLGTTGGTVDTRAVYAVSGTTGTLDYDSCTFDTFYTFGLNQKCTVTDCIFLSGGLITIGGAIMSGATVSGSTVAADASAMNWNYNADPNGELDDMSVTKGTNAHHAIEFGTSAPLTMTLTGWTTSGFNASDGQNDSTFYFADRGSDVTWTLNIIGGSGIFTYKKARAGDTVNIVISPVTLTINAKDSIAKTNIQGARVAIWANTGGNMKADAAITSITRATTTATVTTTANHGLSTGDDVIIQDTAPTGALNAEAGYRGIKNITVTGVNTFTFTCLGTETTPATRTYQFSEVIIANDLTDASGNVSDTRTYSADQPLRGYVMKGTYDPTYVKQEVSDSMTSAANKTINISLVPD